MAHSNNLSVELTTKNGNVKQEIFETENYEQDFIVEAQQVHRNEEQTPITDPIFKCEAVYIKNEIIIEDFDLKKESNNEALLMKNDNECENKNEMFFKPVKVEELNAEKTINDEFIIKNDESDTNDGIFQCESCYLTFDTEIQLNDHTFWCKTNSGLDGAVNQIQNGCESADINKSFITKSMNSTEKPFKCDICNKAFDFNAHLSRHKLFHSGEKPYECDVCMRKFSQKANLNQHKLIHIDEKLYGCDVCDKRFNRIDYLNQHKSIHTGEKPYECDVCGKNFVRIHDLNRHKRSHSGEKPFECHLCKKKFNLNFHLTEHMRCHTGEKPYKCEVCNKTFAVRSNLRLHTRIHTGGKPYKCDVCKKTFTLKHHLKRHKTVKCP